MVNLVKTWAAADCSRSIVIVLNNIVCESLANNLRACDVNVILLGRKPGSRDPIYLWRVISSLRKNHVDIMHCHNRHSLLWCMMARIFRPRTVLIMTAHTTGSVGRWNTLLRAAARAFITTTVAISKAVEGECLAAGFRQVRLIGNGVELNRFLQPAKSRHQGRLRLITVGRLVPSVKGQDVVLRAMKICIASGLDLTCTFVGAPDPADPGTLTSLQKLAEELQIADRALFLGSREDVPELLKEADIFVLASRREGFGLAALEAIAAGLPVILSRVGGLAELIEHDRTGLYFDEGSEEALAGCIMRLADDPAMAEAIAASAQRDVQRFDISRTRQLYSSLYCEVRKADRCGGGRGARAVPLVGQIRSPTDTKEFRQVETVTRSR
jgi:glycosyltransferase involved in cell wall biosynthesis